MWLRHLFALASVVALWSCSETIEPYADYYGDIDRGRLYDAEQIMRDTAETWDLLVVGRMRYFPGSPENNNLVIYLLYDEEAYERHEKVVWIVNGGSSLSLMFFDYEWRYLPMDDLDRFIEDLKGALESGLGMEFCRMNLHGRCDEESAQREARRLADMRRREEEKALGTPRPAVSEGN